MWYLVIIALIPAAIPLLSLAMIHLGFRAPRIREKRDPDRLGLAHKEELVQFLRDSGFPVYSRAATWHHIAYW